MGLQSGQGVRGGVGEREQLVVSVTDSRRPPWNTKHQGFRCECLNAQGSVVTLTGTPNVLSRHATQGGSYTAEKCSSEDAAGFLPSGYLCGNKTSWNSSTN